MHTKKCVNGGTLTTHTDANIIEQVWTLIIVNTSFFIFLILCQRGFPSQECCKIHN